MPQGKRFSIYLNDDEVAIADATADRLRMSRSQVIRHLILYNGLCGGTFPLTSKILDLAPDARDRIIAEIRKRAESDDPAKPQSFRQWVKETLGNCDPADLNRGAEQLLNALISGEGPD